MKGYKIKYGSLIHETAIIGCNVEIGEGNIIMPYAVIGESGFIRDTDFEKPSGKVVIGSGNRIGAHTCIMSGSEGSTTIIGNDNLIMNFVNIGHDSRIGNNNEIGAGSVICGNVTIEDECKIKVGCTIRNRVTIGSNCLIGMGSVVTKSFKNNGLPIFGNPAN